MAGRGFVHRTKRTQASYADVDKHLGALAARRDRVDQASRSTTAEPRPRRQQVPQCSWSFRGGSGSACRCRSPPRRNACICRIVRPGRAKAIGAEDLDFALRSEDATRQCSSLKTGALPAPKWRDGVTSRPNGSWTCSNNSTNQAVPPEPRRSRNVRKRSADSKLAPRLRASVIAVHTGREVRPPFRLLGRERWAKMFRSRSHRNSAAQSYFCSGLYRTASLRACWSNSLTEHPPGRVPGYWNRGSLPQ